MDRNTAILPRKDLKIRPYSMDMENHIVTLPKKGLKARPYSMNMNKEDQIVTPPKKGLKTRPYSIDMEKKDLKKLSKSELIKMLLKKRNQRMFVTMRIYSTTTHLRTRFHNLLP